GGPQVPLQPCFSFQPSVVLWRLCLPCTNVYCTYPPVHRSGAKLYAGTGAYLFGTFSLSEQPILYNSCSSGSSLHTARIGQYLAVVHLAELTRRSFKGAAGQF